MLLFCWRVIYPLLIYEGLAVFVSTVVSVLFSVLLIGGGMSGTIMLTPDEIEAYVMRIQLPATALAALLASAVLYGIYRSDERKRAGRKRGTCVGLLCTALLGICACLCGNALLVLLPIPDDSFQEVSRILYAPSVAEQIVCMGFIIPLAEELVFRGLAYRRMRERAPMPAAALLSAVLFALFHGNLAQGVYAGLLGLLMAVLYEWYGTLKIPYVLHMTANITSVLLTNSVIGVWMTADLAAWAVMGISGLLAAVLVFRMREDIRDEIIIDRNTLL